MTARRAPANPSAFRILVVDDDEDIRSGLKESLERMPGAPVEVQMAADGLEALSILNRGRPFALVISDERMPGMRGIELLEWVRGNIPSAARVLVTGQPDEALRKEAKDRAAVDLFIAKPFALPGDLARVKSLLGATRPR